MSIEGLLERLRQAAACQLNGRSLQLGLLIQENDGEESRNHVYGMIGQP